MLEKLPCQGFVSRLVSGNSDGTPDPVVDFRVRLRPRDLFLMMSAIVVLVCWGSDSIGYIPSSSAYTSDISAFLLAWLALTATLFAKALKELLSIKLARATGCLTGLFPSLTIWYPTICISHKLGIAPPPLTFFSAPVEVQSVA